MTKRIEEIIVPTQEKLFNMLCKMYKNKAASVKGEYILVRGEAPIMLVAHLDTVHKEPVRYICKTEDGNILMSPQGIGGDDRCGVYALISVYERAAVKPWLLFTCDEEIGGVGAKTFCAAHAKGTLPEELDSLKAIVEIDRKGAKDAVYYDCENYEFEDYITSKGFETNYGSFSDISHIAPELGVAAVNLSSGYYNAHTQFEYINRKELNATIDKVLEIVEDSANADFPYYEYIEAEYCWDDKDCGYWDWSSYLGAKTMKSAEPMKSAKVKKSDSSGFAYQREYDALIDLYGKKELDKIRTDMGDAWIEYLFESEFGGSFDEVFGDEEEEEI